MYKVTNEIETMVRDCKDMNWNNLNKYYCDALEQLKPKKSLIITVADKGGAIVVMNRKDYVDTVYKDVNNKKYYQKLDYDNSEEIIREKHKIIEQVKDSLNDTEYNILTDDSETETPVFYGLPKIHKEYEQFPLLRPFVAGYRSATVKLSEYVDNYLKPAVQKVFHL